MRIFQVVMLEGTGLAQHNFFLKIIGKSTDKHLSSDTYTKKKKMLQQQKNVRMRK